MTLEQAKKTRDKYLKIIGMTSPLGMLIIDVIAEPLGILSRVFYNIIENVHKLLKSPEHILPFYLCF